jgi:hypothetical protein
MKNYLPISQDKKFKYSITFQSFDEESLEAGETKERGYEVEDDTDTIGDVLYKANTTYGIYMPVSFGIWESTEPDEDTDFFEKGIRKFYALHISNEDGTDISQDENDFISFLLSDGRFQINKFRDYEFGGIVLGTLALGIGASLIAYLYLKDKKETKELQNNRAKSVTHIIKGKERKFPIKDAWKREHTLENKSEKYEVPQADRKPIKFEMGGEAGKEKITEKEFRSKLAELGYKVSFKKVNFEDLSRSSKVFGVIKNSAGEEMPTIFFGEKNREEWLPVIDLLNKYTVVKDEVKVLFKDGGGVHSLSISKEDYYLVVNNWVYFTFNYPMGFVKDAFNSKHLEEKFSSYYTRYGSVGVLMSFWANLDNENRKILSLWIKNNYFNGDKSKLLSISDDDYSKIITHWNMFCFNFPYGFVERVFEDENTSHFEQKWIQAYERAGATGSVNKFFTELSGDNQRLLTDWVYDNYKGMNFADGGGVEELVKEKSLKYFLLNEASSGSIANKVPYSDYDTIGKIRIQAVQILNRDGDREYSLQSFSDLIQESLLEYEENKYENKYEIGGEAGSKMSYEDFVETLQEYEIEGGFGKTLEKGLRMYYLPNDNPYFNTKFNHRNLKKAYKQYLQMKKFANGGAIGSGKNGYIAMYKGKKLEVYADTKYEAQQKAAQHFKAKKSYEVDVYLAELDGKQYITPTDFADGGGVNEKKYYNNMNREDILSQTVVYDNDGESFDRYTVFTPDGSVFGMSENATGFNQYIGDNTEIEQGNHLGKKLKSVPKGIESAVLDRMIEDTYAKGDKTDNWVNYDKNHLINTETGMIVLKETDLNDIKPNDIKGFDKLGMDKYDDGGEVQEWMEEALESLIEETGLDDLEITIVSDNGNEFIATDGDAEYRVFKTEDDAKETAIEQVREDLEESPENFNKDFISNYIDGRDFFKSVLDEMNKGYAEDIKSESDDIYANRLVREMVENGILNEDDALSGNAEELADYYMQDFVNLMTEGQLDEGNDGLDYFISNFGEEYTMELVIDNNLIDVDEASKDAVQTDGIEHFLSSYDGETVYLSNDSVAYRVN